MLPYRGSNNKSEAIEVIFMDASVFWNVIGTYNEQTIILQIVLLIALISAIILSYTHIATWAAKFALGMTNLFIGVVFFGWYGTEPIQKYFALPLYLLCGGLFLFESWNNRADVIERPNLLQRLLLLLFLLYPLVSLLLGNTFPQMVTYIMPCPVVSLSIIVYACYQRKNKALLILLTVWGLTGIKSVIFNAYEDIILLLCGLYGVVLCGNELKQLPKK